jgi:hypothetical protein
MKKLRLLVRRTPIIRGIALFILRIHVVSSYIFNPIEEAISWIFRSKEFTNFTYDLSNLNKRYLIAFIAGILGRNFNEIEGYIAEIESDLSLRAHLLAATEASSERYFAEKNIYYGRRLGWYAVVRATRPKVVVETSVDKGLGSCVITSALKRNASDGFPGRYYGTDINPSAGYLLTDVYKEYGKILYGDSIMSLKNLNEIIDVFINDSDHSLDYEAKEYKTIADRLHPNAIIISDNSHITSALLDFAIATNRNFMYFQEKPINHWYSGAGLGIAFPKQ